MNQNLKSKLISSSISYKTPYFLSQYPKDQVFSLLVAKSFISRQHIFYQGSSNWSSIKVRVSQSSVTLETVYYQTFCILVLRKALEIFYLFSSCIVTLRATISILRQNQAGELSIKMIFLASTMVLFRKLTVHSCLGNQKRRQMSLMGLLRQSSLVRRNMFSRRKWLAWKRMMNSFLKVIQYFLRCQSELMILICLFLCSSISKEITSELSLQLSLTMMSLVVFLRGVRARSCLMVYLPPRLILRLGAVSLVSQLRSKSFLEMKWLLCLGLSPSGLVCCLLRGSMVQVGLNIRITLSAVCNSQIITFQMLSRSTSSWLLKQRENRLLRLYSLNMPNWLT